MSFLSVANPATIPVIDENISRPVLFTSPVSISCMIGLTIVPSNIPNNPTTMLIASKAISSPIFIFLFLRFLVLVFAAIHAFPVRSAMSNAAKAFPVRAVVRAVVVFYGYHRPVTAVFIHAPSAIRVFVLPFPAALCPQFFRLYSHCVPTTFPLVGAA